MRTLAVAFATLAVSLLAAVPGASAADMQCNHDDRSFNACLDFSYSWGWWTGYAGLDVRLAPTYAQEVLACDPNFRAELWGDDGGPGKDDYRRPLSLAPGSPRLSADGISVDFVGNAISPQQMNEDDGEDELYAKIFYDDNCHTGLTRPFRTGVVRGEFRS
jgi:hypothetical protein